MKRDLDVLVQHRDAILLAEIGALIHDLGKLSKEFVTFQSAECAKNPNYSPWCQEDPHMEFLKPKYKDFVPDQLLDALANKGFQNLLKIELGELKQSPQDLGRFIAIHTRKKTGIGLITLIAECDGIDSGVDKGALPREGSKQSLDDTRISTAFGYEKSRQINTDELRKSRHDYAQVLADVLSQIKDARAALKQGQQIDSGKWKKWLYGDDQTPGLRDCTREAFRKALGETRRAANDVTLWDHSYSVASLYKAALAKILLDGQWTEPKELQWRILRISLDGLSFLNSVHRVPDILGRQQALTDALDKVKELLEVEYPLGNEIYRDENGSAFVVPDVDDLLDRLNKEGKSLRELIEEAFAESELKGEIKLILSPEAFSDASRGAILLGELLKKPTPLLTTDPDVVEKWWSKAEGLEICTVCGLRPQSYGAPDREKHDQENHKPLEGPVAGCETCKTLARNICYVCLERRGRRSQEWATKGLDSTIWIDEVADINARVALIVGCFLIDDWLNGAFTDSIFTQTLALHNLSYDQLIKGLEAALEGVNTEILNKVGGDAWRYYPKKKKLKPDSSPDEVKQIVENFYEDIVNERDVRGLSKGVSTIDDKAKLLALFLFRKHPSFARLRRIWKTTQGFWQVVRDEVIPKVLEKDRGQRLEIEVENKKDKLSRKLGDYHVYDAQLKKKNLFFSVVWDTKRLITADNLQYLSELLRLREPLEKLLERQNELPLYEPAGYGMRRTPAATAKIKAVKPLGTYTPAIPILTEPRTFMVLVPAKKALEVVAEIKKKYEIEMGKVRNRLSLFVGIVYFHRRIPLRAALEAGRRMLRMQNKEGIWEVKESRSANDEEKARYEGKLGSHAQYLGLQDREGREISWIVPYSLGDDSEDYYYPYFFVEELAPRTSSDELKHLFRAPRPGQEEMTDLVHVKELQKGDKVYITPSRFDFEFLETSGRRFEVSYNDQGLRRNPARRTRPYLLEEIETLQHIWWLLSGKGKEHPKTEWKGLTTTQIEALVSIIEAKREEWNQPTGKASYHTTFEHLVKDVLRRADWPDGWAKMAKEDQSLLEEAAKNGILADVVELYMTVMKEKPKKEEGGVKW